MRPAALMRKNETGYAASRKALRPGGGWFGGDARSRAARSFCDIYNRTEKGMSRERLSPRYTMMTLLGLHRYERSGRVPRVAISPVAECAAA